MTFKRALTDEQELELVDEYKFTDITVDELCIMFKVSRRTVFRVLAKHHVRHRYNYNRQRKNKRKRKRPPLLPCGTDAAYQRHKRNKEYPCTPCLEAHAASVAAYKSTPPKKSISKRIG